LPEQLDQGIDIPVEIKKQLQTDSTDELLAKYSTEIHSWFPMLSKKRLLQDISDNTSRISFLLLSLKLVTTVPECPEMLKWYVAAKVHITKLEVSRNISLRLLQSVILVALYELGHGIFPAGYLTVGYAARMGIMMGLHDRKGSAQLLKPSSTWTLREEERRAWWAIFLLDR
jgi:hypothetical protein